MSQNANSLNAAGIHRAKAIVITFKSIQDTIKVIQQIEQLHEGLPILARAKDEIEMDTLLKSGATQVIPDKAEGSVMLGAQVLSLVGVPLRRVMRRIGEVRENRYGKLRGYFPGLEDDDIEDAEAIRLSSVHLKKEMSAIGKTLEWLEKKDVVVQSVRRKQGITNTYTKLEPLPELLFEPEDILVLSGNMLSLEKAEKLLTKSPTKFTARV
jgi:CPA2 family monovalent cation:H+ antiporter-2